MLNSSDPVIVSVEDLVAALGGNEEVARLAGLSTTHAVSNWGTRRRVPAAYFLIFQRALKERGHEVSPDLFGIHQAEVPL